MSTKISLCFICDDNYVLPTVVAITSVIINKNRDDVYDIYVVVNNLSNESIDVLKKVETESVRVIIVKDKNGKKYDKFKMDHYHVTTTSMFKFDLPDLLPDELEKVLYLDGDIIVQKDVASIFNKDIGDVYAGVVKDFFVVSDKDSFQKRLNVNHSSYFNAGVLLLNLKKLREDHIPELLLQYRNNHEDTYMDQDTFNAVLGENVKYFPFYCNFQFTSWNYCDPKKLKEYYGLDIDNIEYELINKVLIIHYNTWYKPWNYYDFLAADIWLYYYLLSPFKDIVALNRKSLNEIENTKKEEDLIQIKQIVAHQNAEIEFLKKYQEEAQRLARELNDVKTGWSFKTGRALTFIPRKLRDFIKS